MLGISRQGKTSRINIGIKAGEGRNVTPANAEMQIEVLAENEEINSLWLQMQYVWLKAQHIASS